MHLYKINICTDGMTIEMFLCMLLGTDEMGVFQLWWSSMWILCSYGYICISVFVL